MDIHQGNVQGDGGLPPSHVTRHVVGHVTQLARCQVGLGVSATCTHAHTLGWCFARCPTLQCSILECACLTRAGCQPTIAQCVATQPIHSFHSAAPCCAGKTSRNVWWWQQDLMEVATDEVEAVAVEALVSESGGSKGVAGVVFRHS